MAELFGDIFRTVRSINIFDIIDIFSVSILFYFLYKFMRERRSGRLALGVVVLLLLKFASELFDMYLIQFILQNVFQAGLIAVAIIFQPELRSALEKVGASPLRLKKLNDAKNDEIALMVNNIASAAADLSSTKTGALIVIERLTKLGDLILTGTVIDADPSPFLIKNIFFNNAPLHDGALIVRDARLHAAGCFLPLSQNDDIVKDLGTRHRAAIGASENSDAVVVVVSEETGIISVAVEGVLYRGYDKKSLSDELRSRLVLSTSDNNKYRIKNIFTPKNKNSINTPQ